MKYFTKEWYELCQKTSAHLLLEEDVQAEVFSEEYFQQLYNQKLKEFLDLWKEVASISHGTFDSEKLLRQFEESFINNQRHIKNILPKEILIKIEDIRVYALNRASRQVIDDVTRFCENNANLVHRRVEDYNKYYEKGLMSFDKEIVENIHFHDCIITEISQIEQSLLIIFDNSEGFTNINEIQFENYKIIKQDASMENSWWLYEEIYETKGGYELQVLLKDKNMNLIEFSVSAEQIFFKYNQEKRA